MTHALDVLKTFFKKSADVKTNTKPIKSVTTKAEANVLRVPNATSFLAMTTNFLRVETLKVAML